MSFLFTASTKLSKSSPNVSPYSFLNFAKPLLVLTCLDTFLKAALIKVFLPNLSTQVNPDLKDISAKDLKNPLLVPNSAPQFSTPNFLTSRLYLLENAAPILFQNPSI